MEILDEILEEIDVRYESGELSDDDRELLYATAYERYADNEDDDIFSEKKASSYPWFDKLKDDISAAKAKGNYAKVVSLCENGIKKLEELKSDIASLQKDSKGLVAARHIASSIVGAGLGAAAVYGSIWKREEILDKVNAGSDKLNKKLDGKKGKLAEKGFNATSYVHNKTTKTGRKAPSKLERGIEAGGAGALAAAGAVGTNALLKRLTSFKVKAIKELDKHIKYLTVELKAAKRKL